MCASHWTYLRQSILYFLYFPDNAVCLYCCNTFWRSTYSQEYFTTIVYPKLGGQTSCVMGNWKIENVNTLGPLGGWSVSMMPAVVSVTNENFILESRKVCWSFLSCSLYIVFY